MPPTQIYLKFPRYPVLILTPRPLLMLLLLPGYYSPKSLFHPCLLFKTGSDFAQKAFPDIPPCSHLLLYVPPYLRIISFLEHFNYLFKMASFPICLFPLSLNILISLYPRITVPDSCLMFCESVLNK